MKYIYNFIIISVGLFARNILPYSSQLNVQQDRFLNEHFFKNKKNGVFIDIGAHDGKTHSNSYFFETVLNWSGICIEPMPHIFAQLKQNRKAICLNCCVSSVEGTVQFLQVEGAPSMLSGIMQTYDPRHLARIKLEIERDGGSCKEVTLPSRNFNNIVAEHNIKYIDYLSIDTEGSEFDILKSIDFEKVYIFAISIENNYQDSRFRPFLESKGFRFVSLLGGQDEIYVNKK
jgi:FkbM family methyltransferase